MSFLGTTKQPIKATIHISKPMFYTLFSNMRNIIVMYIITLVSTSLCSDYIHHLHISVFEKRVYNIGEEKGTRLFHFTVRASLFLFNERFTGSLLILTFYALLRIQKKYSYDFFAHYIISR